MRPYRDLSGLLALAFLASLSAATEKPDTGHSRTWTSPRVTPALDHRQIDHLVRRLGSDNFSEREAASNALDAIGEPAWDALRRAQQNDDAEIRRRAAGIMQRMRIRLRVQR